MKKLYVHPKLLYMLSLIFRLVSPLVKVFPSNVVFLPLNIFIEKSSNVSFLLDANVLSL